MGQSDAVYSVTEATSSEILTKKAQTERRTAEVAPKDVKLGGGGMRVRARQELGDEGSCPARGLIPESF